MAKGLLAEKGRKVLEAPTFEADRGLCAADLAGTGLLRSLSSMQLIYSLGEFVGILCLREREREEQRCIPTGGSLQ